MLATMIRIVGLGLVLTALLATELRAESPTTEDVAFFVKEVLPILRANCFACHGSEKKLQGGLRLTGRDDILKGGESGSAVDLKHPGESLLLQAINYDGIMMPPKGKLPKAQIDTLTKWVARGLPWSEKAVSAAVKAHGVPVVDDEARNFWAFQPVVRHEAPQVKDLSWVRTPIDAFVLAKLEANDVRPAPIASEETLLRRLTYTLTGLPPTPKEVADFVSDQSPDAYEKVVDRLLNSRRYGEHWGRHWLDLVRYAESNSFERDNPKPFVWRYRDYVIRTLNADKPYDQFIREQLAGDELDEVTPDSIIATGYYRLGLWDDEPADRPLAFYDGLDDIVGTTSQTFLGLTANCARCHDHKIDPFLQKDYYSLLSFLHGIKPYGGDNEILRFIGDDAERKRQAAATAEWEAKLADVRKQIVAVEDSIKDKLPGGEIDDFKFDGKRREILRKQRSKLFPAEDHDKYEALHRERERLERERPKSLELALAVKEEGRPRDTFVLLRGNPQAQGDRVEPAFPSVLLAADAKPPELPPRRDGSESSGRRLVLANWIASPTNPLTARVMVNRVWQFHFGRGLVRSSSNFGYAGSPPTHPELLDWLASEFVRSGWKLKPLHRLIVTSNAFRMASVAPSLNSQPSILNQRDPENDLLSHFDLRRLSAEEVRDSILAVCGNLNLNKTEGPSVYPVIPREVLAGQSVPGRGWEKSTPEEAASRSVFVHIKRSLAVPLLAAFDAADPDSPCPVRFTTTQPSQALALINSTFANEQAALFAQSLRREVGTETAPCVRAGLVRVLQRQPTEREIARGVKFVEDNIQQEKVSADEALRRFCLLAINLNEFVYLD
ncbi:MAG: PSD1 and planctomycete cytochrome C domain-containing protein [Planctomycetia bacterium]|nr:PSD1 and planctomycete cytochrome C domain-containing protein [Planctomycetia bacterium]